jgi:hypothetical protein
MDLLVWARKRGESPLHCSCIHFAVTTDKEPSVLDGLAGLSLCVCVLINMYVCVWICMYIYIYIYKYHTLAGVGAQVQRITRAWSLQSFRRKVRQWAVRVRWTCWPVSVCVYIYIYVCV